MLTAVTVVSFEATGIDVERAIEQSMRVRFRNNVMDNFKLLDVVALTKGIPEHHLRRGQVGTIVEVLDGGRAFEVEFASNWTVHRRRPSKMMVLQYEPEAIAA